MNKPNEKACEAAKKSYEICNILCRGPVYGYGREAVMSFIRERIKEFLLDYVAHNNCAINPFDCEIDDDSVNEDAVINLPCCRINWLTAYGSFSIRYYNEDRKKTGEKADVFVSSDAFRLFYDFDENKNYGNVKEEYFNKYYKKSPEQIYDYLKTVLCKRIIDNLKNFYDKRLVSCNEIKPLKGVDVETNKECIQELE
jgi:hypothetical protein